MKECYRRIILDIKDIEKDSIENIYYFPDEDNILVGYALIIGPENTPYQYGNYMFNFNFSENYPHSPPIVTYLSNDGITRFNPNFYRSGKVCLSILNTWEGEKWSACQSLRSILLTLQTRLNEYPLLNEPGFNMEQHSHFVSKYNSIIKYKNIIFCIFHYLSNEENVPIKNIEIRSQIHNVITETFKNNADKIKAIIDDQIENHGLMTRYVNFSFFNNMSASLNYVELRDLFIK
jgi:ubiquitin-conjugating enzyme E2 Z